MAEILPPDEGEAILHPPEYVPMLEIRWPGETTMIDLVCDRERILEWVEERLDAFEEWAAE